jgi:ABC-type polysaccharide/polyol phosphate export permease
LILPLAPLGVYLALAAFRVFSHPDGMTAAVYMTVGATLWLFFAGLVTAPMTALRNKGALAAKTGYPLIGVVLSKLLHVLFDTLLRAVIVAVVMIWQQPPHGLGFGLLAMLAGAPLFLGAGLILALFATAIRDLDRAVPLFLQYAFFLSYAIFPLPLPPALMALNPFAVIIDNARHVLMFGELASPIVFASWCGFGLLLLLHALGFLGRAERIVAGRL